MRWLERGRPHHPVDGLNVEGRGHQARPARITQEREDGRHVSDSIDDELATLVPDAKQGDRRALQGVIRVIHPPVLRYARARIGGGKSPTPEDVAQEVCLAVS